MSAPAITLTPYVEFPEVSASTSHKLLVMADLKAPVMPVAEGTGRKPISVSAVIDRSGSMDGPKLALTKATLQFVINQLTPEDEFGIVAYATDVTETLPLRRMDAAGRRRAAAAVASLRAAGCTNLAGGLFTGLDQLRGKPYEPPPSVEQQPDEQTPSSTTTLKVQIGNTRGASPASAPPAFPWMLFVQAAPEAADAGRLDDHVQRVEFELHTPGQPTEQLTVAQAPFQLGRMGHTAATVTVHITLTARHGATLHTFHYCPNFAAPVTFTTVELPLAPPLLAMAFTP
eukprot:EG_transcript_22293